MAKYRVLYIVKRPAGGVQFHRQITPHNFLQDHYPDFECIALDEDKFDVQTDQFLSSFQLIQFSRWVSLDKRTAEKIERVKKAGLKVLLDLDDYWEVEQQHYYYDTYKRFGISNQVIEAIMSVDHVTCTHTYFADLIGLYNPEVSVLPNAIDIAQKQWQIDPEESEMLRFGWFGSLCHDEDMEILRWPIDKLSFTAALKDKFQTVLGGFHLNEKPLEQYGVQLREVNDALIRKIHGAEKELAMARTEEHKNAASEKFGKLKKELHDKKHELTFPRYERIMSAEYRVLSRYPNYVSRLKQYDPVSDERERFMPYRRIWSADIFAYGAGYNKIDVALAPLADTLFNRCKSQLKAIEAGFMKKAMIASNIPPFTIDLIHKKNALLCRTSGEWNVAMRSLIADPDRAEDLAEALHETMTSQYSMARVTESRAGLYSQLIDKTN